MADVEHSEPVTLEFQRPDPGDGCEPTERLRVVWARVDGVDVTTASQLRGAVDLVEQARGCVTAALNCTAHPWHGDDRARKWLMDADRLGGQ